MTEDNEDTSVQELKARIDELEAQVDEQQETIAKMLPSRRSILKGGATLGAGALVGYAASGTAVADPEWGSATGAIGEETSPLNAGYIKDLQSQTVNTEQIGSERHYAGAYSGSDPDTRLDNALSAASNYDVIYLEKASYTSQRTVSIPVKLVGVNNWGSLGPGAAFDSDLTVDSSCILENINLEANLDLNARSLVNGLWTSNTFDVTVDSERCILMNVHNASITLTTNSANCIVDDAIRTTVTDNGSSNSIGETT